MSEGHIRGVSEQWTWIHESGIQVKHILARNINLGSGILMLSGGHIIKLCEAGEDVYLVNLF